MGLFNKKLSLEEILKAIKGLSEEEKAQVKAEMEKGEVAEEETSDVENMEEQVDNSAVEEETEQPEEMGEVEEGAPVEEEQVAEEPINEPSPEGEIPPETEQLNGREEENKEDVVTGLTERVTALEEKLAQFEELKGLMEEFTKKQADSFGYKGAVPGAKKDIQDMSASELKQKMLNGEI